MRSLARRRGQVLVYPWVHPAALVAVAVVVILAVVACVRFAPTAAPPARNSFGQYVRHMPTLRDLPRRPEPQLSLWPAGKRGDALLTGNRAGLLRITVLDLTLQNGARGRPMSVAIEPYGLSVADSTPWPVPGRGATTSRRVDAHALVRFHVAPFGPGWARTLADVPFYDAPFEPRTRVVTFGQRVPHLERDGFAGQPSLRSILGRFVHPDGTANLAQNQALLMWEFTSEFDSPAADFQDVVALVELVR